MKNKNFLKKIAAITLGFVMTLGVGAAGYAASASESNAANEVAATFTLGSNGAASHSDGTGASSYSETNNNYTLSMSLTNGSIDALDQKGNGCIKLGASKKAGAFSFTVPTDIVEVKIYAAKYKTNSATVNINNVSTTLSKNSDDGAYDAISVNTSSSKSVSLSVTNGNRCMVNTIEFLKVGSGGGGGDDGDYTTEYIGELSFGLSSNPGDWPTTNSTTMQYYTYSISGEGTFKFGLKNVKCGSGYLMLTQPAILELPSFTNSKLTKVVAKNSGSCSTTVNVAITSDTTGTAVSGGAAQTWSTASSTYTYNLTGTSTDTPYYLYVTNKNAQITELTLTYASGITHTVGTISGSSEVYVGKTETYSTTCNQSDAITWSVKAQNGTSATTAAEINDSSGLLTAKTVSNDTVVTVIATCAGGGTSTKAVTIKKDVETLESITVSGQTTTFTKGTNFSFGGTVTGTYSHTNGDEDSTKTISSGITYTIDGTEATTETVLSSVGDHTVVVSADGKSASYAITVNYAAVESISLDYTESTLGKGGEATLPGVTILPKTANQGFSWSNPPVATAGILYDYNSSSKKLTIDSSNTVGGTIVFTATATGDSSKTATVTYTIEAAQIATMTGVNASATGEIVSKQYVGNDFNPQGFSFTPTWSEGEHEEVTIAASDIEWNALVANSAPTGTYTYNGKNFTVTISGVTVIEDFLASIAFANGCDMTDKEYWVGESWDFSGLSIVGTMDSGTTAEIDTSKVSFTSDDEVATTTSSITVTAHYQGFTGTEPTKTITGISVSEVTMTSLSINYTGGQPVLGTDFVFAGTIKGNMSNGTQQDVAISDVEIGEVNKFTTTQQTIRVEHKTTKATGTFNVQYKVKTYPPIIDTEEKTLTIRASDVGGTNNSYALKDWTVSGVTGKSYTYASTSGASAFQFNGGKGTNICYNTSALPGKIKSIKMTKSSGTDRDVTAYVSTSAMTSASGTSLGTETVTSSGTTWTIPDGNTNNNVYFYLDYTKSSALYVSQIEVVYEEASETPSTEKHPIRIYDASCTASSLLIETVLTKDNFKFSVQYDTGATASNIKPTSIQKKTGVNTYDNDCTLTEGNNVFKLTYTENYNNVPYTVTGEITVPATPKTLSSISLSYGESFKNQFGLNESFTHNDVIVTANYLNGYQSEDVTSSAAFSSPDMSTEGSKTITVTYGGKEASYNITVTEEKAANLIAFTTEDAGATAAVVDESSGTFSGYVGNTVSLQIELINFTSNANIDEASSVQGLTLSDEGEIVNGVYYGEISVNAVMSSQQYKITVSEGGKEIDIVLSFSAIEDYVVGIDVSNYKNSYVVGEDFNSSVTVKQIYYSGKMSDALPATAYSVTPPANMSRGEKNFTVSSNGFSKQVAITVNMPDDLYVVTKEQEYVPGQRDVETTEHVINYVTNSLYGHDDSKNKYICEDDDLEWVQIQANKSYGALFNASSVVYKENLVSGNLGYYKLSFSASAEGSDFTFTLTGLKGSQETAIKAIVNKPKDTTTKQIDLVINPTDADQVDGFKLTVAKNEGTNNCQFYNLTSTYKEYVDGQPSYRDVYNQHDMSETMFDFIYNLAGPDGSQLTADKWDDLQTSMSSLSETDKTWFIKGVAQGGEGFTSLESCEMFTNFINSYDKLVATQGLPNYLNRPLLSTCTITINYDNGEDNGTAKVIQGEKYTLPGIPTKDGYVFQGWLVNGETKDAGSPITVSENITIKAQWVQGITFSSEFGFKFTGLDITRFQLIFNGTCPDDAKSYGFLYTKSDIDLIKLTATDIQNGVTGVGVTSGTQQAVFGTSNGNTELTVVFYYIDGDEQVHYSEVITTSFDEMASKYDLNQITDPYARLCLEYYLANLAE